jgi:nucleotide-binding universal stress UspA family protein
MDQNLVVLDGSTTAQNAARLAVQIAKVEHQKILGLYVVDETLVLDTFASYQKELGRNDRPDSRAELTEWFEAIGDIALDQLKQLGDREDVPVETQLLFGGVPELILESVANAQMLTLGRRGRGHATDPGHLGSYFRQIAHHTQVPILVGGDIYRPIKHLFTLNDGSPGFDRALEWTVRLQRHLSTNVNVAVMDLEDPNQIPPDIQEQMLQHGLVNFHHRPLREESISAVLEEVLASGTDLILCGGYRHPEILEWLVGGRTDQLLRQSQLPVLIA